MSRKLLSAAGVLLLTAVVAAGVVDLYIDEKEERTVGDTKAKVENKPAILKDYMCLRDGDLCHPDYQKNRGIYVSCSNGVAWEQKCPPCSQHLISCPTKSLWFDGEKCDWASPKLASQPCVDRFAIPNSELSNGSKESESVSDEDLTFQTLQVAPPLSSSEQKRPETQKLENSRPEFYRPQPAKDGDKPLWGSQLPMPGSLFYKAPKNTYEKESEQQMESGLNLKGSKAASMEDQLSDLEEKDKRTGESDYINEQDFPSFINADDSAMGSKIVKLAEPVYALVNNPDGSGKQVLMRVFQPFVFDDTARGLIPNVNFINPYALSKN